ncbi:MAG: hypothetical protein ABJ275_00235 [Maricaulaceae bacterium]
MKSVLISLSAALALSACATTSGVTKNNSENTEKAAVAALVGGEIDFSKTHQIGPISCPNRIGPAKFNKVINFDPNATNVGCFYESESVFYTLYAYDQKGRDLTSELQGVVNTVLIAKKDWDIAYDEDASKSCVFQGLIMGALSAEGNTDITIDSKSPVGDVDGYNFGVGIMTSQNIVTIGALHSRDDMFFKLRATSMHDGGISSEIVTNECQRMAQAMRALDKGFDASKVETKTNHGNSI